MKESKLEKNTILKVFLLVCAFLINIKYILVDFGIDAAFQTTMSYRLVEGDLMFKQMWEPYQMSAFLCAFFEKIYLSIFSTTTGMVIYLQIVGVIIDACVSLLLYLTIKKLIGNDLLAFLIGLVGFLVAPKDVPFPEYTNMLIWFSILLFIAISKYMDAGRIIYVILAIVSMCGMVLSYPSSVIVCAAVVVWLIIKKRWKVALAITGGCMVIGAAYLVYVFSVCPPNELAGVIHNILSLETSHSETPIMKIVRYMAEVGMIIALNAASYLIAFLISSLFGKAFRKDKAWAATLTDIIYLLTIMGLSLYMAFCWQKYIRFNFYNYFIPVIILGVKYKKTMSNKERSIYIIGMVISIGNFLSGLILTNLRLMDTVPLLLIGVLVSFIPLSYMVAKIKVLFSKGLAFTIVLLLLAGLMARSVYVIRPINGDISSIIHIAGITKKGPAKGIVSEYMGPYMQNETYAEWEQYINEGDAVMLIGGSLNSLAYMYKDVEISAPSLVPTPDYNESLLTYWEQNPEKYPDVVIASCWFGQMNSELTDDSFIMTWLENEYKPSQVVDGKYWRYYFK